MPDTWYLVRFTKTGAARFLSQHDVRRAWERVTRRAGLPLAYSRGFSPKPRLSFGPPLPVGAEGRREYMTMALRDPLDASQVQGRLTAAAIPGMAVVEVARAPGRRVRTTWATYTIIVNPPPPDLSARVERLLALDTVQIQRARDPEGVTRDIRPGVGSLQTENGRLLARLRIAQDQIVTSRDLALALEIEAASTVRTDIELDPVG
ncbi:MAG: TIGR03936 family radical SAM-associated protein [Chloroflexota bacterium]|nr:TIGR03936 family radical SAM-associated protein [Chloroflexota bacterium]MDE2918974.1 TIGR03936 family radical SAM-associated protein [Chloroflexota bacterium]